MKTDKKTNRRSISLLMLLLLMTMMPLVAQAQVKREFRGAWIQCVNGQWLGQSTQQMQQTLKSSGTMESFPYRTAGKGT